MKNPFFIEMSVRDYECDLQGIVNNAVYQHYLEHARHEFLHAVGLDFARLHADGLDAVVTRIEMRYRRPLGPGDRFRVSVEPRREGRLRICFFQRIERADGTPVLDAEVTAAFIRDGRPVPPDRFLEALAEHGVEI